MNRYSTAIALTGLLLVLINQPVIAKEPSDIPRLCHKINNRASTALETTKEDKLKVLASYHPELADNRASSNPDLASLWWAAEQFDPFDGKLVENWLTYPEKHQIELVVSWQLWTLLDYLERYRFVNQFGTVARKYGYGLTIFNQKYQCLASYSYNSDSKPPKWELDLQKFGRDSLPIEPQIPENIPLLENSL